MNISNENKFLLYCARTRISEQHRVHINDLVARPLDWIKVSDSAYAMGLYPLLYHHTKDIPNRHCIPQEFMNKIKKTYHENTARNMFLYHELRRIIQAFRSAGIDTILLKGAVLAKIVYGDIGLRSMSDLDILIREQHLPRIKEIMSNLDYITEPYVQAERRKREKHFHLPQYKHQENNTVVEIHRNIVEESICLDTDQWWNRARLITIDGCDALMPSPGDMLIHLCLHLYNHGYENNILLRGLCDINEMLRYFKNDMNWHLVQDLVNEHGIHKQVISILHLIRNIYHDHHESLYWIDQYDLDLSFITILKERIFIGYEDSSAIPSGLIKFFKFYALPGRMKFIRELLFPSRQEMSERYSVNSSSRKIYLYYFFRPFILLKKYGKNIVAVYRFKD